MESNSQSSNSRYHFTTFSGFETKITTFKSNSIIRLVESESSIIWKFNLFLWGEIFITKSNLQSSNTNISPTFATMLSLCNKIAIFECWRSPIFKQKLQSLTTSLFVSSIFVQFVLEYLNARNFHYRDKFATLEYEYQFKSQYSTQQNCDFWILLSVWIKSLIYEIFIV